MTESSTTGGEWLHVCKALRALIKDPYHYAQEAALGEGEAFEKLARVKIDVDVDDQTLHARVVIRSNEAAVVDGFILIHRSGVTTVPGDETTYPEIWAWALQQPGLALIPFDVKVVSLKHGSITQEASYYNWSVPQFSSKAQAENAQFIITMVEGVDSHLAVLPTRSWKAAREQWVEGENTIHIVPPWIALGMVPDADLDTAIASVIRAAVGNEEWYTNPSNGLVFAGRRPASTAKPSHGNTDEVLGPMGPGTRAVQRFWDEVRRTGGRIHFNPFAPVLVDFVLWLPDVGHIWVEHKSRVGSLSSISFHTSSRQHPFHSRRVWHFLYCQADDGALCVPRNEVDPAWAELNRLPKDVRDDYQCADFADAYERIIKPHSRAARAAIKGVVADLSPASITEGLPTKESSARLKHAAAAPPSDDPRGAASTRQWTAAGVGSVLNGWCREAGRGVCLALGGGNPYGTHVMVHHRWTDANKQAFDDYGELPLHLFSPGVADRRYTPLWTGDYSAPSNVKKGIWFPFALRKEGWKMPVAAPRGLIIGTLTESPQPTEQTSWVLLLPTGLTAKYNDPENLASPVPISARASGEHLFRRVKLDDTLVRNPAWGTQRSATCFEQKYLLHENINLGRYVLNLLDGTVYHEIMKILRSNGRESITNPLLRKTTSQQFDATEYQGLMGDLFQGTWEYGYDRQDAGRDTIGEEP